MADETGRLLSCVPDGDCYRLTVEAPAAAAAYTAPGQYCTLSLGGDSGYFAMMHAPRDGATLQFAVKPGGAAADALIAAAAGTKLSVGSPAGRGYPLQAALDAEAELVFVGTGSGAGALHAVMEAAHAAGKRFTFYQGHRVGPVASAETERWAANGCQVHTSLSQPPEGWTGSRGRIQAAIEADAPDWRGAWVFICGQKGLFERISELGERFGLPEGRLSTNY